MVLHMFSLSSCSFTKLLHRNQISLGSPRSCHFTPFRVQCLVSAQSSVIRRSAGYEPSIWDYKYIQSLRSEYGGESYAKRIEELKADVRVMLDKAVCKDLEYHITLGTKYKNYETRFTETTIYRNKKVYTPWLLNLDYLDNMGMIQPQKFLKSGQASILALSWALGLELWTIGLATWALRNTKAKWAELCKLYLEEAKWYNSGYTPTFQEYMDNAWICMDFSGNTFGISAYIFTANPLTDEAMECLLGYPNIVRWAAMIVRLVDDLGTSSHELKRGDVAKSIQCYMRETGASEEDARQHIQDLVTSTWMKIVKYS
ncbi:hypothetical protein WN944_009291 [Citrus x changshan-huyou]|uniref:Terpene synthase metal-binding domain-containing protein n=1 Tax=Citrus x changshan-huyou TaxID=2935761 RepID=A0AAP0MVY3_9ROSI